MQKVKFCNDSFNGVVSCHLKVHKIKHQTHIFYFSYKFIFQSAEKSASDGGFRAILPFSRSWSSGELLTFLRMYVKITKSHAARAVACPRVATLPKLTSRFSWFLFF